MPLITTSGEEKWSRMKGSVLKVGPNERVKRKVMASTPWNQSWVVNGSLRALFLGNSVEVAEV